MEFDKAFVGFKRLWFFSNVLSTQTPVQFRKPSSPVSDSDPGFVYVCKRVRSWLEESVETAIEAVENEEEEAEEAECRKGLENAEQSTLIALLMLAPANSIKSPAVRSVDRGRKKGGKVKSVMNELFGRKRSVLGEIQSGYVRQL